MKDCSKVLFHEIDSVSPCKSVLRVDREKNEYGILEVQNRDFFNGNEQTNQMYGFDDSLIVVSIFRVYAVIRIMINITVFFLLFIRGFLSTTIINRNWFRTTDQFTWNGEFTGDFLSHLSHLEFFERVEDETKRPENERFYQVEFLAKQHSTARQIVSVFSFICLFCRFVTRIKSIRFNLRILLRCLFHFVCSVSVQFQGLNIIR